MKSLKRTIGPLFFLALLAPFSLSAFDISEVQDQAKRLATQPYVMPSTADLPPELNNLDYDGVRHIIWKDPYALWPDTTLPFHVEFFHRTNANAPQVKIYLLDGETSAPAPYSEDYFKFGKLVFTHPLPPNLGYAGFRIHFGPQAKEFAVFLGASYFRGVGPDLSYGLSARGVAVNPGIVEDVEEFPNFTSFWIKKPDRDSQSITVYALLDGPSMTGAYEFQLSHPGDTTMEVHATLYFRKAVDHLGIAPLSSMYWIGKMNFNHYGDFRPEVHDSDGALIHTSQGEWVWRPLQNNVFNRWNSFADVNPRGFGLIQRERNYAHYEDIQALYHLRPNVWITPLGDWGAGAVTLAQIPTNSEYNDNEVLFWEPANRPKPGDHLDFGYRMTWGELNDQHPELALCSESHLDYPKPSRPIGPQFILAYSGTSLAGSSPADPPIPEIGCDGQPLTKYQVIYNRFNDSWRVTFCVPDFDVSHAPVELTCRLFDKSHKLVSETWGYTWFPKEGLVGLPKKK